MKSAGLPVEHVSPLSYIYSTDTFKLNYRRAPSEPGLVVTGTLYKKTCNIMLNSLCQHNCSITQGSYVDYMFQILISHLQAYSS